MEIPIDYHILFLAVSFLLFILAGFLMFIDTTLEKAILAFIFCMFNVILNFLNAFIFSAVDLYGFDTTGAVVHNVYGGMHPLSFIFVVMMYINILFMVYCVYLFIRKPWTDVFGDETKVQYKGPSY